MIVARDGGGLFFLARADMSRQEIQRSATAMRSLTTRRCRPCGMLRCSPAPGIVRLATRAARWSLRCAAVLAGLWAGAGLLSAAAMAQRSAVTVDLGALDTLGPADPAANPGGRIRLHMPDRKAPPVAAKSAPVPAIIQRPAAAQPQASAMTPAPTSPAPTPSAPSTAAPRPPAQALVAPPASTAPLPTAEARPPAQPGEGPERILFQPDDASLADEAKQELDRLATRLSADGRLYVQLVAYAGSGGDASQARRLSLSRALAARSYLVDHGVEIKQIDLRPLGNKSEPGISPDRIDLVVAQR